jgi:aminopeptidase N/puromycin-sensitive aminopeptidase
MTEATGKPVNQVMPGFVNQPGVPLVTFGACTNGKVTLEQKRYFANAAQFEKPSNELWQIPVCLKTPGSSPQRCEIMKGRTATISLGADARCPSWAFGNAGALGYYDSAYPPGAALTIASSGALTPGEQIDLLNDEWAMVDINRAAVGDFLAVANQFHSSTNPPVLDAIVHRLEDIDQYLTSPADRESFLQWVRNFAAPIYRQTGFVPQPGEDTSRAQVRNVAIQLLAGIVRDPDVINSARSIAGQYLRDPNSVNPSIAGVALQAAALTNDAALYDQYLAALKTAKDPGTYYRFFNSLPLFDSPALLHRTLEFALSAEVRNQDTATLFAIALQNERTREATWDFIRQNWDEVDKHLPPFEGEVEVVGSTSAFCDAQHLDQVKQFFTAHPAQGAERTLQQSLDAINQCIALRSAQQPKLAEWLKQNAPSAGGR